MDSSKGHKIQLSNNCICICLWLGSVADPYNFDTDPDPGCEKIRYGSGSRQKQYGSGSSKKGLSTRKIFKSDEKRS